MRRTTLVAVVAAVIPMLAVPPIAAHADRAVSDSSARKNCARVKVIGHRGVAGPHENTVRGWNIAKAQGVDAIEADVWLTRDGVPVIIHDSTWKRTTNWHGRVHRTKYSVVRRHIRTDGGDRIPTLWRLFRWAKHNHRDLLIELKWSPSMKRVNRIAKRLGVKRRISFYAQPQPKNGSLRSIDRARKRGFRTGVKTWYRKWPMGPKKLRRHGRFIAVAPALGMRRKYVRRMHRAGLRVYPKQSYKPNWPRLLRAGVDAVVVHHPGRYRAWCRQRNRGL